MDLATSRSWVVKYWRPVLKFLIIPLVVLWLIFLFFDVVVMPVVTRHGEEFVLPQVVGMTELEAEQILKKKQLNMQVAGREYSANKPEGVVLSQLPGAGMMVKTGRYVKVVISAGVKVTAVPDVRGLPLQQANLTLQKAGFSVGDMYWTRVDTLPDNVAIETIPTKGTLLPLGSKVSLAVNQGREVYTVFMPQLVGLPLSRARSLLDSLGLTISDLVRVKDTLYLPGTILDQAPARNAPLAKGDAVRLTVSETD